ncbi:MAG TPA: cytochrome C oxidase subunit IV family protein [Bacteroidales bacterium]
MENKQHEHSANSPHISSYRELTGVWVGLIILTLMTVFISTFGAELRTLSVATALLIATVKALAVGFYFMHLKYEPKIYNVMMLIVLALFSFFLIMVILDYFTR